MRGRGPAAQSAGTAFCCGARHAVPTPSPNLDGKEPIGEVLPLCRGRGPAPDPSPLRRDILGSNHVPMAAVSSSILARFDRNMMMHQTSCPDRGSRAARRFG
ncbi:hypothetical protein KNE206_69730 [Kitasatospora sp. NE20-6]